jgi:hypothetical protein
LQQQVFILTKLTEYATTIVSQSTQFGIVITTMTTSIDGENGHTNITNVQQEVHQQI